MSNKKRFRAALERKVRTLLAHHAPGAYERLQNFRRTIDPSRTLSAVWQALPGALSAPSDLHPVLADANLLMLERPEGFDEEFIRRNTTLGNEALEHVVDLNQIRQSAASVCFIVPVLRDDTAALEDTVQSVLRQTDPNWELLLCSDENSADELGRWLEIDWRVRRFTSSTPLDEASFLKRAAIQATTLFIGLLSQGDVVDDDLVKSLSEKLRTAPTTDIVYTDEARRMPDQRVGLPFYKPDWSPEHQQSVNMLGRFVAIRKSLLLAAAEPSGVQPEATEYGLNLALTGKARRIMHIDEPLYIRAATYPSYPVGGFFSNDGLSEARDVLEAHVRVEAPAADVAFFPDAGSLHVRWPVPAGMPVTLLILTGMQRRELPGLGEVVLATHFVRSIVEKSSAANYKIVVVHEGTVDTELKALLDQHGHSTCTYPVSDPFSFARKANFATSLVNFGIVLLLNDDLEVVSPDWIQELAGQAARSGVGAVGCRLLFGDGTLQHAGIRLGFNGSAVPVFHHAPANGSEYGGFASIDRNYSAVTGAVMAYRKEVFDQVGGFDEKFGAEYNDIDFCLKCIVKGLRVVYTGTATLYHFHNPGIERTHDNSLERQVFFTRWSRFFKRDPYFNKNFQAQSAELPLVAA